MIGGRPRPVEADSALPVEEPEELFRPLQRGERLVEPPGVEVDAARLQMPEQCFAAGLAVLRVAHFHAEFGGAVEVAGVVELLKFLLILPGEVGAAAAGQRQQHRQQNCSA